jgi:hypothetical protein
VAQKPGPDRAPDAPGREVPDPPQPPDMEPVIPQNDPPAQPGRPGDGEPPPIVAARVN